VRDCDIPIDSIISIHGSRISLDSLSFILTSAKEETPRCGVRLADSRIFSLSVLLS
jgi:hypothetical protein